MKTLAAPLSAALLVLAATFGLARSEQDAGSRAAAAAAPAPDAFHAGAEHALLQKLVGTWDAVIIAPDGKGGSTRTKGSLTTTKHTDFHTVDSFEGDFMGMKLIGHGMNGYCTVRRKFFSCWTDSMTSSPMISYGDWDEKKRELDDRQVLRTEREASAPDRAARAGRRPPRDLHGGGPDGKEMSSGIEYARRK